MMIMKSSYDIKDSAKFLWQRSSAFEGYFLAFIPFLELKVFHGEKIIVYYLDVSQIVAEKRRFQKNPTNYAQRKTDLLKQKVFKLYVHLEKTVKPINKRKQNLLISLGKGAQGMGSVKIRKGLGFPPPHQRNFREAKFRLFFRPRSHMWMN